MEKSKELFDKTSCLNKSVPNEPIFVLCARDVTAPQTIRHWAAMNAGKQPPDKIISALDVADHMEKWHEQNDSRGSQPAVVQAR